MSQSIKTTLKIIGILIVLAIIFVLKDVIGYLLLAFVFASALRPEVDKLEKYKIPRVVSTALISILFISVFIVMMILILPSLISEIQNFAYSIPTYWENWFHQFEEWTEISLFGGNIEEIISNALKNLTQGITSAFGFIFSIFGQIFNILFALVVAFYLVVEGKTAERFSDFVFGKNKKSKDKMIRFWDLAENIVGKWFQGYVFLGVVVAIMVYIGLSIIGVEHALLLAVLAGFLEIIPWLGPLVSGIFGFFLALLQGGIPMALLAALVFLIVQQIENFLIVPSVMKNRVNLNPLITLVVIFIGGIVWGVLGMILSVPISAILVSFWKEHQAKSF